MIVSLLVSRPVISQSIQTRGCLERDSGIVNDLYVCFTKIGVSSRFRKFSSVASGCFFVLVFDVLIELEALVIGR